MAAQMAQVPIERQSEIGSDAVYVAHPLNVSNSTNIRLLSLLPNTSTDSPSTIRLDINVFSLENAPPYSALSYVWGQELLARTVILGGVPMMVRSNLWDFLDRARHDDSIQHLWIDALCIDQSSIPERNHQVAIMGHVFLQAKLVVAWLGGGPPDLVEAVRKLSQTDWSDPLRNRDTVSFKNKTKPAIAAFCNAEYWCRMWTIQEFVLPKTVDIWCGRYEKIPSTLLRNFAQPVSFDVYSLPDSIEQLGMVRRSYWLRCFYQELFVHRRDLTEVLVSIHESPGQCTDVKDRIYSILTLTNGEDYTRYPLLVNYELCPSELFLQLLERRFGQLDNDSSTTDSRLRQLILFLTLLSEVLEVKGAPKVAPMYSKLNELWMYQRGTDGFGEEVWRQAGTLCQRQMNSRYAFEHLLM